MVVTMMDCSTAHIKPETAKWIDEIREDLWSPLIIYPKAEYGWFIHVLDEPFEGNVPEDLRNLINYARSIGCSWLMLVSDGYENQLLPKYKW